MLIALKVFYDTMYKSLKYGTKQWKLIAINNILDFFYLYTKLNFTDGHFDRIIFYKNLYLLRNCIHLYHLSQYIKMFHIVSLFSYIFYYNLLTLNQTINLCDLRK